MRTVRFKSARRRYSPIRHPFSEVLAGDDRPSGCKGSKKRNDENRDRIDQTDRADRRFTDGCDHENIRHPDGDVQELFQHQRDDQLEEESRFKKLPIRK